MTTHERKRFSAAGRREQIITTAIRLFAQSGFNGTTTKDIARAVGVSEALLFKFFPHKTSLYSAIIQYKVEQISPAFSFTPLPRETLQAFFTRLATQCGERMNQDDSFMRLLLFSALEGHQLSTMFFNTRITQTTLALAHYLRQGMRKRLFRPVDPLLAARLFTGMIYHYFLLKKIFKVQFPPLAEPEKTLRTLVDIFLQGIKHPSHTRSKLCTQPAFHPSPKK